MARKVWFQLVDARGTKLEYFSSVKLKETDDLDDFTEAVKERCQPLLANTPAASLSVLKNINGAAPLLKSLPIGNRGRNGEAPLLVRVPDSSPIGSASGLSATLPPAQPLLDVDTHKNECGSLDSWAVGQVHEVEHIWKFFKDLGGCTEKGKLLWRQEEQDLASIVLGGWLGRAEMDDIVKKKTILVGSPGVGKSTLLCLLAFYAVFKLKKNVLVYRLLAKGGDENCLIYIGYENGQVVYSTKMNCDHTDVKRIYDALVEQHTAANLWLFLDGFVYLNIPTGFGGFRMLATSQQVDLTSQDDTRAYCILHPCWKKNDLVQLAREVYGWDEESANERFYYSGGSVRGFTRSNVVDTKDFIDKAMKTVEHVEALFSQRSDVSNRSDQVDRLRHTFLGNDPSKSLLRRYKGHWEQVVDSEYAIALLSTRLKVETVERMFNWATAGGTAYASLAGQLFEILIHLLAKDKVLVLHTAPYANGAPGQVYTPLAIQLKEALHSGTEATFTSVLGKWKDDDKYSYWYPDDPKFSSIDAVVKLTRDEAKVETDGDGDAHMVDADAQSVATTGKTNEARVAYLQMTVAQTHSINARKLKEVNDVFDSSAGEGSRVANYQRASASEVKAKPKAKAASTKEKAKDAKEAKPKAEAEAAGVADAEAAKVKKPFLYVLVCPTREKCETATLATQADVSEALEICDVHVGYYERLGLACGADGLGRSTVRIRESSETPYPATRSVGLPDKKRGLEAVVGDETSW